MAQTGTEPSKGSSEGDKPKQGAGLAPNIASLLCYICLPIPSIVFIVIEKENLDVKFHAWQGTLLGAALILGYFAYLVLDLIFGAVSSFLVVILLFFAIVVLILFLAIVIICMVKAYQGERWRVPYLGDIAAKRAGV